MTDEIDNLVDYLKRTGLNTITVDSPVWKLLYKNKKVNNLDTSRQGVNSIVKENGQKMTVGKLVRHRTVPQLGLGLVVAESKIHKGFWIIQWCDVRYYDVGRLGIQKEYLEII